MLKKIMISGFEGWASVPKNPSSEMLKELEARSVDDFELITIQLPVDTYGIAKIISLKLDEVQPDVWIAVGVRPGGSVIDVERMAVNLRDFEDPDNHGEKIQDEPIFEEAPAGYPATLPVRPIFEKLRENGIPSMISNSASTYLCNQLMYTLLHLVKEKNIPTLTGFLHVPLSPYNVALMEPPDHTNPSMSIDVMADAVLIAAREVLNHLN